MDLALFRDTSSGPRRPTPEGGSGGDQRPSEREPMFNAPWPAVALTTVIVLGYAIQSRLPEIAVVSWAFTPADLQHGRFATLVTALFLHGNWAHALLNAAFALAFGSPVARLFGTRPLGVVAFFGLYLLCGALASLGYAAVHPGSEQGLVGASGAVAGLMAAAARLMAGHGRPGPILSRIVLGMGGAWLAINLIVGAVGGALLPGTGGAGVAWEAHIAGFLAGLVLVSPFAWLARRG